MIECRPAVDLVSVFDRPETLFYVDPPYVKATRANASTAYRHEMTDEGHRELIGALRSAEGIVLVSGYDSGLYAEMLGDWHRTTTSILKRTSNRHRDHREAVTEVVWANRPLDEGRLAI